MQELLNMAQAVLVEYEAAGITDVSTVDFAARMAHRAVLAEREACASAVESERLEGCTDSEGDQAYNTAITHAAKAIRMRSNCEVTGA